MIQVGEVVWQYDGNIRPPGSKMYVCVCPQSGFYFRINSKGHHRGSVPILKAHNGFLEWDSFIECNGPQDVDDFSIEEAIDREGIIGRVDNDTLCRIVEAVRNSGEISPVNIEIIVSSIERHLAEAKR